MPAASRQAARCLLPWGWLEPPDHAHLAEAHAAADVHLVLVTSGRPRSAGWHQTSHRYVFLIVSRSGSLGKHVQEHLPLLSELILIK